MYHGIGRITAYMHGMHGMHRQKPEKAEMRRSAQVLQLCMYSCEKSCMHMPSM